MSNEAEVASIADALHKILELASTLPPPADRSRTYAEIMAQTQHQEDASFITRDPIGASLRLGIEVLGERLNEIGGQSLMISVLEDVAARDPEREEWRTNIMDKRWNGIGSWLA